MPAGNEIPDPCQESVDAVYSAQPGALLVTGYLRELLTVHFSTAQNLINPVLRELIWRRDKATNILIESSGKYAPESTGVRPAVIIHHLGSKRNKLSFGSREQGGRRDGEQYFSCQWSGRHRIFAIAESQAQSQIIGDEVERFLNGFALEIAKAANLRSLEINDIQETGKMKRPKDAFGTPLVIEYTYSQSWRLRSQLPKIDEIVLSQFLDS